MRTLYVLYVPMQKRGLGLSTKETRQRVSKMGGKAGGGRWSKLQARIMRWRQMAMAERAKRRREAGRD